MRLGTSTPISSVGFHVGPARAGSLIAGDSRLVGEGGWRRGMTAVDAGQQGSARSRGGSRNTGVRRFGRIVCFERVVTVLSPALEGEGDEVGSSKIVGVW